MSKRLLVVVACLACVFTVGLTDAQLVAVEVPTDQSSKKGLSLNGIITLALDRSPSIAALREKLAAEREMVTPAGALANPMIELMYQEAGFPKYTIGKMEMSMIGPEVRQTLPFPGKRNARRAVADALVQMRTAELDQLRRQLVGQIRSIYAMIYALDQERSTIEAAKQLIDMLAATATMRYSLGEAEQEALIKAQIEISRIDERSDDLTAERAKLVATLNRVLDQPGDTPLGVVKTLPPVTVPPKPWDKEVMAFSPEIAARRAAIAAAEYRLEIARLDLKPDFTTGAALGVRGGFDPVLTLRFGVELPFWRKEKQKPMIRAAEHELEMARAELREAEAAASSEAARLLAQWQRAERQIIRYREALMPQSSAAVDAARSSYLAGRGDFSTVVEDFRLWLETRSEMARREADRFETWAELMALIENPAPVASDGGDARVDENSPTSNRSDPFPSRFTNDPQKDQVPAMSLPQPSKKNGAVQ